jgi:hypothetical protein
MAYRWHRFSPRAEVGVLQFEFLLGLLQLRNCFNVRRKYRYATLRTRRPSATSAPYEVLLSVDHVRCCQNMRDWFRVGGIRTVIDTFTLK